MKQKSKRFRAVATKVEPKNYTISEAVQKVKETASAKFSETMTEKLCEAIFNLSSS